MTLFATIQLGTAMLAATEPTVARRLYEWTLPQTPLGWIVAAVALAMLLATALSISWRDTVELGPFWRTWLASLRLAVLLALAVIAMDPKQRTQKIAFRPSRAVLLVDRSLSMQLPADSVAPSASPSAGTARTRFDAVRNLLTRSGLIDRLRQTHEVVIYTFDSKLSGPVQVFRSAVAGPDKNSVRPGSASQTQGAERVAGRSDSSETNGGAALTATSNARATTDWLKMLEPRGPETRLGESLLELIRQVSGRTLSGIVVLSDGASNAGLEPTAAHAAALAARTRLIAVGVGGLEEPANVQIANIQAPTDVQVGDAFDLSAFIQGQGVGRKTVQVELLQKQPDDTEPVRVESRDVTLVEDGVPVQVTFHLSPSLPGETEYTVRVTATGLQELSLSDNQRTKTVNLVDRKTRVLLIGGGPMREYRFVRNLLYRHSAIELDVWLQTVDAGTAVSQDADRLLLKFPESREELFQYDVLIAFDPDWSRLSAEGRQVLGEWVFSQSGGLILVAGDIYTPQLAGTKDEMKPIGELYPVILTPFLLEYQLAKESQQAWPVRLTQAGREADFLQIADDPYQSQAAWKEFPGVYRCYPTSGAKAGATIYAYHTDPRAQTEFGPPILMASQFYGSGQVLYIGTSELWRLRRLDEAFHDRLWTKLVRKVGQARLQRGTNRGLLLLERSEYWLGQTVSVRAQLLDPQFRPLDAPAVAVEVYTPAGKPLVPELRLLPDKNRPGQFVGSFRAALPGTYRLEIPIPQSNDVLAKKIEVLMPNRETDQARQNAQLLRNLVRDTGGAYLTIDEAAQAIPKLLPNQGEEYLVDDRLETLWDRQWVLYALVCLLSVEWLTRKLLKLA